MKSLLNEITKEPKKINELMKNNYKIKCLKLQQRIFSFSISILFTVLYLPKIIKMVVKNGR